MNKLPRRYQGLRSLSYFLHPSQHLSELIDVVWIALHEQSSTLKQTKLEPECFHSSHCDDLKFGNLFYMRSLVGVAWCPFSSSTKQQEPPTSASTCFWDAFSSYSSHEIHIGCCFQLSLAKLIQLLLQFFNLRFQRTIFQSQDSRSNWSSSRLLAPPSIVPALPWLEPVLWHLLPEFHFSFRK